MRPEVNLAKRLTKTFCLRLVSWEQRIKTRGFCKTHLLCQLTNTICTGKKMKRKNIHQTQQSYTSYAKMTNKQLIKSPLRLPCRRHRWSRGGTDPDDDRASQPSAWQGTLQTQSRSCKQRENEESAMSWSDLPQQKATEDKAAGQHSERFSTDTSTTKLQSVLAVGISVKLTTDGAGKHCCMMLSTNFLLTEERERERERGGGGGGA